MKIELHKVTWYSKLIALIIFVVFPFVGFYWGIQYGETVQIAKQASLAAANATAYVLPEYYVNPGEWQTDQSTAGGFSIAYPIDFMTQDNFASVPTSDWSLRSNGEAGVQYFVLTIPKAFEPQTNFDDATLVVGSSRTPAAIRDCTNPGIIANPGDATSTRMVNGTAFSVYHFTGAGAGNYYETTSYHTLHAGQCYSIGYTIHSGQIANYPSSYNLHQFNDVEVSGVLERIINTFTFL